VNLLFGALLASLTTAACLARLPGEADPMTRSCLRCRLVVGVLDDLDAAEFAISGLCPPCFDEVTAEEGAAVAFVLGDEPEADDAA
jgi:hypothetical protein